MDRIYGTGLGTASAIISITEIEVGSFIKAYGELLPPYALERLTEIHKKISRGEAEVDQLMNRSFGANV